MPAQPYGVNVLDQSGLTPPAREVAGAVPFVVGTAPGTGTAGVNEPVLLRSFSDYEAAFGVPADGDANAYTLAAAAAVLFKLYRVQPVVFVNVYDADVAVHDGDTANVAAADVAGSDDGAGTRTGLQTADEVFTAFGVVPSLFLAPGYATDQAVRDALRAKAASHTGYFRGLALLDLDGANAAAGIAAKATAGPGGAALDDPFAVACWPAVKRLTGTADGAPVYEADPMSLHVAGAIAREAAANDGVPLRSPSNTPLLAAELAVTLTLQEVRAVRDAGVVTAQRFGPGGYRFAGNRTSAFAAGEPTADSAEAVARDSFVPGRLVANYVANAIVLDTLALTDGPITRAQVDRVLDAANRRGNALVGAGASLGFRAAFLPEDNPQGDLADGRVTYRLACLPATPMERADFLLDVDLGFFGALFA